MSEDSFTCFFVIGFDTWPIPEAVVITSDSVNNSQFIFIGLPDGSLGLRVIRNGMHEDYETDIIEAEGVFKIVVSISYAPSRPIIHINSIEIESAPVGSREKGFFPLRSKPTSTPPECIELTVDIPQHATHAEALFIRTMGNLADAATSNDWYVILKSSADLRLILLDGLLHKANELHRLKVEFRVADLGVPLPIAVDTRVIGIVPHDLPEEVIKNVNLDQFLKLQVFELKNCRITVKDVIRAAANADGGVHFGNAERAEEELVLMFDKDATLFGQTASRSVLRIFAKLSSLVQYRLLSASRKNQAWPNK